VIWGMKNTERSRSVKIKVQTMSAYSALIASKADKKNLQAGCKALLEGFFVQKKHDAEKNNYAFGASVLFFLGRALP